MRATFDAEGRTVTALLVEAEPWGRDYAGDWKPLRAREADEWPLKVRYLAREPPEAMIATDADLWTAPASLRDVVWIGVLGLVHLPGPRGLVRRGKSGVEAVLHEGWRHLLVLRPTEVRSHAAVHG